MTTTTTGLNQQRIYRKRSDEERIAELEAKIADIKQREEAKKRKDDPLLRDIPKLQRRLKKFADLAVEYDRLDISNTVRAWVASLDRMVREDTLKPASLEVEEDELG